MKGVYFLVTVSVLALATSIAFASDPSPLQDFCVATNDPHNALFVNGKFCKDPKTVNAEDFFYTGLNMAKKTDNSVGSTVTVVNVNKLPGLNTLGISFARIDFAPYGQNPPHYHPRGTEILVVLEGDLWVGFVTSNIPGGKNRLISKLLHKGDVFVFPVGLIHFQFNSGTSNAVAMAGLSSQDPGAVSVANAVLGSDPSISPGILAKAFQVESDSIADLQKMSWDDNNI